MLQSKVILGFIIFMGLAAGYLYYGQTSEVLVVEPIEIDPGLQVFSTITVDSSILEDERYKLLEIFGEMPVDPGMTGKRNIFDPIQ
ncbi:MAG: hypothetical protein A3C61_01755 [Candidatus Yanofskybacteria bacterium RIFCSPHIGHO2_02_FULL_39_10]|uniref:Uncharacterized protein n=1 Tax=Candidatus Yanofskybacteria bacterium RIFCSPHIGHO2_02_FULL_39_10 TaxID=1802674 RepID=A0A1F8F8K2_9BACT|nr:MAG: hypothetical protein A3C61_01755 [Candidatus Yanofskybacteria bacterium RIFCSPHIGHO2_02_FULL_39_10]